MAISDRIQSMYEHVEDIYDSVELTGVDTTDIDKNLVNVPNTLKEGYIDIINNGTDTLYNNFPKVSGEGTSLTLNNTYQAPMRNNLKGNTSQTQYSGKNLLPPTIATETKNGITLTNNGDGSYTLTGTYSSSTLFNIDLPTTLNGTYSFSGNNPTAAKNIQFRILKSSGSPWSTYLNKVNSISEDNTIENGTKQEIRIVGSFTSGFTFKPQLESGSTATSYEPYVGGVAKPSPTSPADVNVVSGDNEITICGKNLFDKSKVVTGYLIENGTIYDTLNYNTSDYIIVEPNTSYYKTATASPRTKYYDKNKQPLNTTTYQDISIGGNAGTFTTPNNAYYLRFSYPVSGATAIDVNTTMLHKGTTATTYEPYQGNTYNIDLPMGINLYDFMNNTYNNEGNLTITKLSNGFTLTNNSSNLGRIIFSDANVSSSKNYVISFEINNPDGKLARLGWSGSSKTVETSATSGKITGVLTGITTSAFSIYIDGNSTITITNLMYYEGTNTSKTYEPYGTRPLEMCNINNFADVFKQSTGKNLLKINDISKTTKNGVTYYCKNGLFVLNGTATNGILLDFDNVKIPAGTYTFKSQRTNIGGSGSYACYITKKDGTNLLTNGGTVTLEEETELHFRFYTNSGAVFKNMTIIAQLEVGETSTAYEPYGVGTWYKYAQVGKYVLDGVNTTFTSRHSSIKSDTKGFYLLSLPSKYKSTSSGVTNYGYSDYFRYVSGPAQSAFNNNDSGLWWEGNTEYCYAILISASLNEANTWLQSHNTTFYYAMDTNWYLCEPIIYQPLIDQLNIFKDAYSKNNQTNVNQTNNDLAFTLNMSALKKGDTIENNSASLLMSFGGLPNTNGEEETPDFEEDVSDVEEETPIEESIEEEIDEEPVEEETEIEEEEEQ